MLSLEYAGSDSSVLPLPYAGLAPLATATVLHRCEAEINPGRHRHTASTLKLMCFSLLFVYKHTGKRRNKIFFFSSSLFASSWLSFWNVDIPIMPRCFSAPWCPHFWLYRWSWSAQGIYWSSYLVLWQAESINQGASFMLTYSRHISALQDTRSQCYPAKFDQQMQFPCATAISDEDVIMWNWAKW